MHYDEERKYTISCVFITDNNMDYNIANTTNGVGSIYVTELDIDKLI